MHNTQPEPAQKETSAPDSPGLETKRPKTLKNSDVKKVPAAEASAKLLKSKVMKSVASSPLKPAAKKPAESGTNAVPCGNVYFKSRASKHPGQVVPRWREQHGQRQPKGLTKFRALGIRVWVGVCCCPAACRLPLHPPSTHEPNLFESFPKFSDFSPFF